MNFKKKQVLSQRSEFFQKLGAGSKLLDIGCFGFTQWNFSKKINRGDIVHYGVDMTEPELINAPEGFIYSKASLDFLDLPYQDDYFDGIVLSHVLEHVKNPIGLMIEAVRVCKPGGHIYIEAPSERSLLIPGVPFKYDLFCSFSYFDDPTHLSRPWSPQSLYRLAVYIQCNPLKVGYITSAIHRALSPFLLTYYLITRNVVKMETLIWLTIGWASYAIVEKPSHILGRPKFSYFVPKKRLHP